MKKVLFLVTLIASLFIIKDLMVSIYTLWHKKDLLIVAQKELSSQQKANKILYSQISQTKKPDFVEVIARNQLFMVKSGESIVILPKVDEKETKKRETVAKPNWQQWAELFY